MATEKTNILKLGEKLWGWKPCVYCCTSGECKDTGCPGRRYQSIRRYYQFCEAMLHPDRGDKSFNKRFIDDTDPHLQVIRNVKANPDLTRRELAMTVWGTNTSVPPTIISETIDRAISIMLMVNCTSSQPSGHLEEGQSKLPWGDGMALSRFLDGTFPKNMQHGFSSISRPRQIKFREELRADRLKKILGIKFRGTADLRDHLRLSHTRRGLVLHVYHHAGFLKEQLIMTNTTPCDGSFSQSIAVCGTLPRQLMLETIDSLQSILFPFENKKARKLLNRLVEKEQWDPELRDYPLGATGIDGGGIVAYYYFAERLSELHDELENPLPRGRLERRFERLKADRYMMMATLAGVAFAVLLGMFSLIISYYQTWISYQAWQHPVGTSG
ncbi:hypothetical protein BJ166DRAFT_267320 [Pestalotiopsis sp. NC0098]|nr:hypothetical protein BJ166DRAFT_267320 [Pestalotiopsis sp. NC0098]